MYIALTQAKQIVGYYVADDCDLSPSPSEAMQFHSKVEALRIRDHANLTWNLDQGQKFEIMEASSQGRSTRA